METPPPGLMAEISKDFEQIRLRRRRRLGLFCLTALGAMLGFGFARAAQIPAVSHGLFWALLVALAGTGVVLCALAFGWPLAMRRRVRPLPWVGLALGLTTLALSIRPGGGDLPFLGGAMCLGTGLGGVALLLVLALALGRSVLRHHAPTGLLLGVGVGLLGLLPLQLACAHASADHMIWHALVPILGGSFGALSWTVVRDGR